jgi:tetratricopeptide (TPR) repeat protein
MFVLALLLIVATIALYLPVKHYSFITFDDRDYVTRNFQIQSRLDWDTVQWSFTTFYSSNWHPLTWLSHTLDYQLFRLNAAGHHETNILFHALNAGLLFWVLWRATGYAGRSFMVAALFALHPINVESVAWISERKNVLSMFFFLLALGAYRWYALWVPRPFHRRWEGGKIGRYLLVVFLYALGLMAKPQIITFPCVLLLWDYWPLQQMFAPRDASSGTVEAPGAALPARSLTWLIVEKLPLFLLSAASAALTIKAQGASGALNGVFTSYPFPSRLKNAIVSYVRYMGKALWPSHLAIFYPHAEGLLNPWHVAGASLLLLAITALVIAGRRRRYFLVGWFWYVGTLIPMIGLVQVGGQAMADRYAYQSFVGLFIMICWGVADFQPAARAAKSGWTEEGHTSSTWLTVASLALLLALTATAHRQLWYWRDSVALWTHATEITSGNWFAEDFLGGLMAELGKSDDALAHYYRALAMNPGDPVSNLNIGSWKQHDGKPGEAIQYFQKVLRSPRAPEILKAKATEGVQRAYHDLGIVGAPGETAPQP